MGPGVGVRLIDVDQQVYVVYGRVMDEIFRFLVAKGDGTIDRKQDIHGLERVLAAKMFARI